MVLLAFVGGYWTVRLFYSDISYSQNLAKATSLNPANHQYQQDPVAALALNPRNSALLIQVGLEAEMDGDFPGAESHLTRAAAVDRQYQPRWTLANYYLRRNNLPAFWKWAGEALQVWRGDPSALFALYRQATSDEKLILSHLPDDKVLPYLHFLLSTGQIDAALVVAPRISDGMSLIVMADVLLHNQRHPDARRLWERVFPPNPNNLLTNGDFGAKPQIYGYDWQFPPHKGVRAQRSQQGLSVYLDGNQPEYAEIAAQYLPVLAEGQYRLSFEVDGAGLGPRSGIQWRIADPSSGQILRVTPIAPDPEKQAATFAAPGGNRLWRLGLVYVRTPGTTRSESSVTVRNVVLLPVK